MTMESDEEQRESARDERQVTNPLLGMLRWDVRLQVKYGIYSVYAVLTLVFVIGVRTVVSAVRTDVTILLIAVDPAVLGFYFIAVLVLYEKGEGVLDALVVSPLGEAGYLLSKTLTLSVLATGTALIVAISSHGISLRTPILIVGVVLSASLFVLIGFVAVARFDSINDYFISAAIWGAVLFSPVLGYLGFFETELFYVLPVRPLLITVEAGLRPVEPWRVVYSVVYLLIVNVVAFRWARRSFDRNIVRRGDSGSKRGRTSRDTSRDDIRSINTHSPWVGLVLTDLKNWLRDPMLVFAAAGPLLLAIVVRFAVPTVTAMASQIVDLTNYYPVMAGTMIVFGPGLFGFIVGMLILEDRDQRILTVYRTAPISLRGYMLYRGSTAFLFALVSILPALVIVDLSHPSLSVVLLSATLGALGGPVIALALGLVASNAIEGIALSKLLNVFLIGPAILIALIPEPWQFIAGVVPAYWPLKTYVAGAAGDPVWSTYWVIGIVIHVSSLIVLDWWITPRTLE